MKKGLSTYAESPTGGLDGDRTHDLLFRRQTLYPLSYKPEQLLLLYTNHHPRQATIIEQRSPAGIMTIL